MPFFVDWFIIMLIFMVRTKVNEKIYIKFLFRQIRFLIYYLQAIFKIQTSYYLFLMYLCVVYAIKITRKNFFTN